MKIDYRIEYNPILFQRCPWRRGSGSIFFEDIEKLHEFDRISVFTNETP
jgi:hypothetical protein